MSGMDLVPVPGMDLVPDGWCFDTVVPWADDQLEQASIAGATAQVAGLLEAYKTLGADTLELTKARRYLEIRWGDLLAPRRAGRPRRVDKRPKSSVATDDFGLTKDQRHEFRRLAADKDRVVREILAATHPDQLSRASLLQTGPPRSSNLSVHYSSATDAWATPQEFFDVVDAEFNFELDVCALPSSAKCERYFTPEEDGLAKEWTGNCWMNPPYGDEIVKWVRKAWESGQDGATVVCLVPARVDTGWWWDYCRNGEIRFLRGRLKFGGADTSAPFPSALVVFNAQPARVVWWEWK
jgi:phage N-6-adenine-methyltransferase